MNSVPIVTVNDLATDSFTADKKGIDLKLSSAKNNGLKLTPEGLTYSTNNNSSASPRVLLGAFKGNAFKKFNFNNEVDIKLRVENLGSDGSYLYIGLDSSYNLKLSTYAHQDATTRDQETNGVQYGSSFPSTYWVDIAHQKTISYAVNGVTRTLMLSYVKLNEVFYVWCDVICTESVNFIDLDLDNPNRGSIIFNGKKYSDFLVTNTYGLKLVAITAFDPEAGGDEYYLANIDSRGSITQLFNFSRAENHYPITQKFNYATGVLATVHNDGNALKIVNINGLRSVDFTTGKGGRHCAIDIYPDTNSTDVLVAVAYGDRDAVDVYRYNPVENTITNEKSYSIDFTYQRGSNYYSIEALKVINTTHIGIALLMETPTGENRSKMLLVNTETNTIVEERPMLNPGAFSGVENLNWLIDRDYNAKMIHVYEFTETGITHILEHQLETPSIATLFKAANLRDGAVGVDRLPGVVFNNFDDNVFVICTPHVVDGAPALHVQTATSNNALISYKDYLGFGEVSVANLTFIAAIDKSLKANVVELTLVN